MRPSKQAPRSSTQVLQAPQGVPVEPFHHEILREKLKSGAVEDRTSR